ncbi:MAG TPA: hypothetical protein VGG01_01485 [Xanthobacteraceae bacterium]|jgi:hypothetical protein
MRDTTNLPGVVRFSIALLAIAGLAVLFVGIYAVVYHVAPAATGITAQNYQFSGSESVVILLVGAALLALASLPFFWAQRGAAREATPTLKQTVEGKEFEAPKTTRALVPQRTEAPPTSWALPAHWSMVSPSDYRAIDDVTILDIPLLSASKSVFAATPIRPLAEKYFVQDEPIAVSLGADTSINNFSFSGVLPDDPQLRRRFIGIGAALMFMPGIRAQIGQGKTTLEETYRELGISDALPLRKDGAVDVEKAFARLQVEISKGELGSDALAAINESIQSLVRKDLPVEMTLRNSVAFVTFRGQDIIESDPALKYVIGGDYSLWNFIAQISRIFPGVSPDTISKMQWVHDQASFQCVTRLNNVRIRGQATSISINRLFFIRKDADLFQVTQATLVSGELVESVTTKSIQEDVQRMISSVGGESSAKQ